MESKVTCRLLVATLVFSGVSALRLVIATWLAQSKGNSIDDVLIRWDAVHYISIARGGYFEDMDPESLGGFHARLAFFPLYPYLMKLVHWATSLSFSFSGILISWVAGIALVSAVMAVVKHMGWGLRAQIAAGVLVVGAPMSLTYNMVYTEAVFGALTLWALWAMLKRRWFLAGALVFFAGLTRLTGIDLWIVFALLVLVYGRREWRAWLALLLSPLGLVGYIAFVNSRTADVGGYFGLQRKGWGSAFDFGASTLDYFSWIFTRNSDSWVVATGLFIMVAVVLVVLTWGKLPWPIWLFAAGVMLNVLLSDGTFTARPRLLIPIYLCLIPFGISIARSWNRVQLSFGAVAWVALCTVISVHPLLATQWAI
ncbi:hypothetical protein [Corynebacterium sp. H130]|uniref:hypothetical protein n=1 Tax=Corynebacterium sp. H130 TaxID=3133444 RepID=UPI0030AF6F3B